MAGTPASPMKAHVPPPPEGSREATWEAPPCRVLEEQSGLLVGIVCSANPIHHMYPGRTDTLIVDVQSVPPQWHTLGAEGRMDVEASCPVQWSLKCSRTMPSPTILNG